MLYGSTRSLSSAVRKLSMIISRFTIKSDFLAPAPFFKMARLSNCLFQNHLVLVGARARTWPMVDDDTKECGTMEQKPPAFFNF